MINLQNSLLFLNICRNTLYESYDNKELKYFIHNEATNYQIMNIIVNNEIPLEKFNLIKEQKLWDQFQQTLYENSNSYVYKLFDEMGPILEFDNSSKPSYADKLFKNINTLKKTATSNLKQGMKAVSNNPMTAASIVAVTAFAANKIYKYHLSKAARACKGKPEKAACMKQYEDKAARMELNKLKAGLSTCAKAKNPENCRKGLKNKISKSIEKISKIKKNN